MVASLGLALRLFTLFIHEPTALGKKPDAPIIDPITAPLNNNKRLTSFLVFRECPGSSSGHIVFVRLFVSNDTGVSAWVVRLWCKPALNKYVFEPSRPVQFLQTGNAPIARKPTRRRLFALSAELPSQGVNSSRQATQIGGRYSAAPNDKRRFSPDKPTYA